MPLHTIPLDSPATLGAASNALQQGSAGDQVLLVLPKDADDLASEVRLQVLRRQADAARCRWAWSQKIEDIRHFARKARIPTFPRWRKRRDAGVIPNRRRRSLALACPTSGGSAPA